jgi:hypothetical protein
VGHAIGGSVCSIYNPFTVWRAGRLKLEFSKSELLQLSGRDIQPPQVHLVVVRQYRRDDHFTRTAGNGGSDPLIVLQETNPISAIAAGDVSVVRGIRLQEFARSCLGQGVAGRLFGRDWG